MSNNTNLQSFNNFSDYYNWEDKSLIPGAPIVTSHSNLVSDEWGNIYFVGFDGQINYYQKNGSQ